MGGDRRRRSRSRSRKDRRKRSPTPERKRKPEAKRSAAAAESSSQSEESEAPPPKTSSAGISLEAKVALLEVENVTLKAENAELKKKLIEALQRGAGGGGKIGQAPPREPTPEKPAPAPAAVDPRRARLAAAAAEPTSRRREREVVEEPEDDMKDNAVMLCNGAMEAYNMPVPNNVPNEKRLPLVKEKLDKFLASFVGQPQILDFGSDKLIIKDAKTFGMRYGCVFRESGSKLTGTVHKRFYFDARGKTPTFCLDFETHESLVTATAGTPPDGKLGVRPPRTEHLIVLYEEKEGKLTRMWLKPDTEKLGLDPTAGEDVMKRTDTYRKFEDKVKELRGGSLGDIIFNNYHDIPSVG